MPVHSVEGRLRALAGQTGALLEPAVPFVIHALASGGAFTLGLAGAQFTGIACRVSCANPVLGPGMGVVGIGVASAMAGQAAVHCRHYFKTGQHPLSIPSAASFQSRDILLDAAMGIILYKMMGGSFRSVMPSDLFKPGALARGSLPAAGKEYASDTFRGELKILMRRDGCHHCGRRKGKTIGDHIPPNKLVYGSRKEVREATAQFAKALGVAPKKRPLVKVPAKHNTWWASIKQKLGMTPPPKIAQRYYPQCLTCCQKQAAAAKANRRTLIVHKAGSKPWHYAGVLVGMRYFHSPSAAGAMLMNDFQGVRRNLRGGFTESDADQHDADAAWNDFASSHTQTHDSDADRWSIQAARRHR
ncbi:TPA: hypothetical protein ACH3X2_010284 [Trebouxia sp. C0005]|nr:MAG: hypothetical protein FRX49_04811 [Trebouxia sp. A1-2]